MTDAKKTALLTFYIFLTGTILLYILFPAGAVRDHITNRINQESPEAQLAIGTLGLSFPPSVLLTEVAIEINGDLFFVFDRLKLTPRWRSIFSAEKVFRFMAEAYGGEMSGFFSTGNNGGDGRLSASCLFSQMHLEEMPMISSHLGDRLSGILDGNFEMEAVPQQMATGSGNVFITNCNFLMPVSFLDNDRLSFHQVEAEFALKDNNLDILNAEMQGPELTGKVSGCIFFETPIERSEMDLVIAVTPLLSSPLSEINALTFRAIETFDAPQLTIVSAR